MLVDDDHFSYEYIYLGTYVCTRGGGIFVLVEEISIEPSPHSYEYERTTSSPRGGGGGVIEALRTTTLTIRFFRCFYV